MHEYAVVRKGNSAVIKMETPILDRLDQTRFKPKGFLSELLAELAAAGELAEFATEISDFCKAIEDVKAKASPQGADERLRYYERMAKETTEQDLRMYYLKHAEELRQIGAR